MYKIVLITLFTGFYSVIDAQHITGQVRNSEKNPLPGANILIIGTDNGVVTDLNGNFQLEASIGDSLLISYVGYLKDTVIIKNNEPVSVTLQPNQTLEEVKVTASSTFTDKLNPAHNEVITEKELTKAACCNLSESFETNAAVDVSYSDAITGAKQIMMLGLDGKYVQINRENIPFVRGISNSFGLSYLPGTWIQSIDVGKGAGSVVNGYESMTGQINVELKKPESMEKLYLNTYMNSFGRGEVNANWQGTINDRWSTALLGHHNFLYSTIDNNGDGFMDIPRHQQYNFINRWKYKSEKLVSQIGIHAMVDEKTGGENGFRKSENPLTSDLFGYLNDYRKVEVFGKTGFLFPDKPYKGWGLIYSASYQEMDIQSGRKAYYGAEKTAYFNMINQNIIGNSFHQYRTGASLMLDDFDESFRDSSKDSSFNRTEAVPGVFFEYTYMPGDQLTIVAGNRVDFHNLYGVFWTPRLHIKKPIGENADLRLSAGRGYRVPNVFAENVFTLVSSRDIIVEDSPRPEVSWNYGASFGWEPASISNLTLMVDYFYTSFENQLVMDMDRDPDKVYFHNLDGRSYASSFQTEVKYDIGYGFHTKIAYKNYDVRTTINEQLMKMPFISANRFFINAGYASDFDIWQADMTLQWYGPKRLPSTEANEEPFQRPAFSEDFWNLNAQVSRAFRWGEVYLGSENMLNFQQPDAIIDPGNPFSENFDASLVWGPLAGRMIYAGLRYKIK